MIYAYLLITLLTGEVVLEPLGPVGKDPQQCAVYSDWAKQRRKVEEPSVTKIMAQCFYFPN